MLSNCGAVNRPSGKGANEHGMRHTKNAL